MKEFDIAIIGAGPAGIMAAIACMKNNSSIVLLEKNTKAGCKFLLTGGGRCNITNQKPIKKLLNSFSNKNFLKHSFYTFTNENLFDLFKSLKFTIEEDDKVFPKNGNANDVLNELINYLSDVEIIYNFEVNSIHDNFIINNEIKANKVIIATGGVTYPQTGCNIKNYALTNHKLTKIKYGLCPLITNDNLTALAGITLYNVGIYYKKFKTKGNILFSHVGLTGPAIIDLSNEISQNLDYDLLRDDELEINENIYVDLCSDFIHEELNNKFIKDFQLKGKTLLKNYLKQFLTKNFIDFFLNKANINGDVQLSQINKKNKNKLIKSLKRFEFKIIAFNSNLAKITIGGIDLSNINPKTMESNIIPNLYFAGEILDVHGPTGGYNLKIAFSTGFLAGSSASEI